MLSPPWTAGSRRRFSKDCHARLKFMEAHTPLTHLLPGSSHHTMLRSNKLHKCRTEQKAFEAAFKPKA